jgi:glycosyltransferase involved in cell wall biosynthesis
MPVDWPEPFGLVVIEALACGTPVIAYGCGAIPELLDDGVTGFIVQDVHQAIAAARRIAQIDRSACREVFERRFTSDVMARNYLALYRELADARKSVLA